MADEAKGILSSKTMLFNALSGAVLMYLRYKNVNFTPEEVATFFAVGNAILRGVTSEAINLRKII